MSRTYYHRHKKKLWRAPRWYNSLHYMRPERQHVRRVLTNLPQDLDDVPELPSHPRHVSRGWY